MTGPKGYLPYALVEKDGKCLLRNPRTGETFPLTGVVSDAADGITDDDFDFDAGKEWAAGTAEATDDDQ